MPLKRSAALIEREQTGLDEELDSGLDAVVSMYERAFHQFGNSPLTEEEREKLREEIIGTMRESA